MAAGIALLEMAAERRGPALLNGTHNAILGAIDRIGMLVPIGRAMAAQDVRQFQPGRHDRRSIAGGRGLGWRERGD